MVTCILRMYNAFKVNKEDDRIVSLRVLPNRGDQIIHDKDYFVVDSITHQACSLEKIGDPDFIILNVRKTS